MNFSDRVSLNIKNGHSDIDFIDVDLDKDTKLYLDPSLIEECKESWHKECAAILNNFFKNVYECFLSQDEERKLELLHFSGEPNETKLGQSKGKPKGKGASYEGLVKVFDEIIEKNLLVDNLIKSPMDMCVFVKNFAEDRMSDLVTNILRKKLNEFTLEQCLKHGIGFLSEEPMNIGKSWNHDLEIWEDVNARTLILDNSIVLLVPKNIVSERYIYSIGEYLSKKIMTHRQDYHITNRTALSQEVYSKKKGTYIKPPSKKTIRKEEIRNIPSKEFAREYTLKNPELIDQFRNDIKKRISFGEYTITDDRLDYLTNHSKMI